MSKINIVPTLATIDADVRAIIRAAVTQAASLCEKHRADGAAFAFALHPDTRDEVTAVLAQMDSDILTRVRSKAKTAINDIDLEGFNDYDTPPDNAEEEEDNDTILLITQNALSRLDKHAARLLWLIEAWLAICFARDIATASLTALLFAYARNPNASPLWKNAQGRGFAPSMIDNGDANTGRGIIRSPINALVLTAQYTTSDLFQHNVQDVFAAIGASIYGVRRMSNYPCADCDEVCAHTYPVGVVVLPVHPNCVCEPYIIK